MSRSIALNFEDGVTRFIECRPDETIADASYRVGINIPLDCRDGVCGTCKCRAERGEYDAAETQGRAAVLVENDRVVKPAGSELCYNAFRKLTRSAWSEADSPNLNLRL